MRRALASRNSEQIFEQKNLIYKLGAHWSKKSPRQADCVPSVCSGHSKLGKTFFFAYERKR